MWPEVRPGRVPGPAGPVPGTGKRPDRRKRFADACPQSQKMCRSHPIVRKSLPNRHISRDKLEKMV